MHIISARHLRTMTRALPVGWDQGPSARATYTAFHGRRLACHRAPLIHDISRQCNPRTAAQPMSQATGDWFIFGPHDFKYAQNVRIVGQVLIWPAYKAADPPYRPLRRGTTIRGGVEVNRAPQNSPRKPCIAMPRKSGRQAVAPASFGRAGSGLLSSASSGGPAWIGGPQRMRWRFSTNST